MSQGEVDELSVYSAPEGVHTSNTDDEQKFRLAQRIMSRFDLKDSDQSFELINKKAYVGGILIAVLVLFWWVLITNAEDNMALGASFLFNLDFSEVSLTVGVFGLVSASARSISKDKGQLLPSLASGAMLIVCGFFILEPLVYGLTGDALSLSAGMFRTARLVALFVGVTYCARFLVEAYILFWLKTLVESRNMTISASGSDDGHDSHAGDALP